ncbi:Hypothetical predicted protein [Pelobates cultripes]|uniref:Uncharacterized protein n=1 Tax=Pelobates cultripes TaxID=61616 RepID=A0AAD1VVT2_PELCU|nr:Hypothetical predicted protein [Pelobates cultripes]
MASKEQHAKAQVHTPNEEPAHTHHDRTRPRLTEPKRWHRRRRTHLLKHKQARSSHAATPSSPQILHEAEIRTAASNRQASLTAPIPLDTMESPRAPKGDPTYLHQQSRLPQRRADEAATGTHKAAPCCASAGLSNNSNPSKRWESTDRELTDQDT